MWLHWDLFCVTSYDIQLCDWHSYYLVYLAMLCQTKAFHKCVQCQHIWRLVLVYVYQTRTQHWYKQLLHTHAKTYKPYKTGYTHDVLCKHVSSLLNVIFVFNFVDNSTEPMELNTNILSTAKHGLKSPKAISFKKTQGKLFYATSLGCQLSSYW